MGIVFILALCSMHRAYVAFSIANRGIWDEMVKDMRFFYGYITLTGATLRWYLVSGLIVWLAVQKIKEFESWLAQVDYYYRLDCLIFSAGYFCSPRPGPSSDVLVVSRRF